MKKIIILIPVFNDWKSLLKLIDDINISIDEFKNLEFKCIIVNDASTIEAPIIKKPVNINSIKVLNMRENRGHARCNAFGLRYILKNENFDNVILMDGDGEDRPEEIKSLVKKANSDKNKSVVAKRIKRSEGFFFQTLYQIHKLITFFFTGKNINFGNYSCLIKKDVQILSEQSSLWSSFSGSVKKNIKNFNEVNSIRGQRYFGPSKMSLFRLGIHSFAIIAVFKETVFLRSILLIILLAYANNYLNLISIILQILLVFFNLLIYLVSLRENKGELIKSESNLENYKEIVH